MKLSRRENSATILTSGRIFLASFGFLLVLSSLWALASPIFSAPDESAHATKAIAQVRGEITGHTIVGQHYPIVDLPKNYRYPANITCFAGHHDVAANCASALGSTHGALYFATWVSGYNPIYYYLAGWPSLIFGGSLGIYAMRIMSALICSVLLAWAFTVAFARVRSRWMVAGMLFVASPMVVYMAASISPQGLEIAAAAALWTGLLRLLQSFGEETQGLIARRPLWIGVAVSAILLANARSTGPLWVVVILAGCVVVVGWRSAARLFSTRRSYLPVGVIAAGGVFSVVWTLATGSLSGQAATSDVPLVGGSFLQGAWAMVRGTSGFAQEAAGVFGWLDTWLPGSLYSVFYVGFFVLLILALVATGRSGLRRMLFVLMLAALVPLLVQASSVHQTGIIWQGRYGLFLYLGIVIVAAWLLSERGDTRVDFLARPVTVIVASLVGVYGIVTFFFVLHRYVVGLDSPIFSMVHAAKWEPPLTWAGLCIAYVVVVVLFTIWVIKISAGAALRQDAVATND